MELCIEYSKYIITTLVQKRRVFHMGQINNHKDCWSIYVGVHKCVLCIVVWGRPKLIPKKLRGTKIKMFYIHWAIPETNEWEKTETKAK